MKKMILFWLLSTSCYAAFTPTPNWTPYETVYRNGSTGQIYYGNYPPGFLTPTPTLTPVNTATPTPTPLTIGYTITLLGSNTAAFTDGATLYFGGLVNNLTTANDVSRIYIPRAGTIKVAYVTAFCGTQGTNETWLLAIRKNDTSDTTIASLSSTAVTRVWSNTALSIAVAQGDYVELKLTNPVWATEPANCRFGGQVYIE